MRNSVRRRRRLSLTSLIDVIFLLLLFFMLSSTFSKFSEVELTAAGGPGATDSGARPLFLQLRQTDLRLNGEAVALEALAGALPNVEEDAPRPLIVSLGDGVSAQRLTDLLVVLRSAPGVTPSILGGAPG